MGPMVRWIATTTLLALLLGRPVAAQTPTVNSLYCEGTMMQIVGGEPGKSQPIKIGLVVNFTEGTLSGFDVITNIVADDVEISFLGKSRDYTVAGNINRVTGAASSHTVRWDQADKEIKWSYDWDLVCKVTNRLF
jgi:hypothetical protein